MSAQDQIAKLQGLLVRVQRNASRPHQGVPATAAPVAFAAPAVAPPQPAPFVAPPPAPAKFDQSVDDLLNASPEPSPLPVDIDVLLDSVPPGAESSQSQMPDADPIPLVSPSSGQAAPPPPPLDDAFALESEVSEVRAAVSTREPAPEVTVDAIAAEAEAIAAEEASEDDLVEVTEGTMPPPPAEVEVDFAEVDEQPPASSQRSKVASSMDEALAAAAADQLEREVPLKTPPPESGPQEAPLPMGLASPAAPDVDALLSGELDIPTRAHAGATLPSGPTPEQLGQTIDLEEARGPSLELAEHRGSALPEPAPVEELEAALPGPSVGGGYDDSLAPPPEAREDLEAHRRRLEDSIPPPPQSLAQYPSVQPVAAVPDLVPLYNAAAGPEVVARPVPMGTPEAFGGVRESLRPSSFVDLLDASLALSGE